MEFALILTHIHSQFTYVQMYTDRTIFSEEATGLKLADVVVDRYTTVPRVYIYNALTHRYRRAEGAAATSDDKPTSRTMRTAKSGMFTKRLHMHC